MATLKGLDPVVKSTFAANETLPIVPVFRKTETVLLPEFATARSGFPSPSTSPMATLKGLDPVVKSILAANETLPIVPVFRKTETVLLPEFATARSGFPSPSTSPIATLMGLPPVVKSNFVKNELLVIAPPPANVTMNDAFE
jgi:hypothetical protein